MRTHMVLPDELIESIDSLVGKRKRTRFVQEAVREKLRRETLVAALEATAGVLAKDDHPEWDTTEKVAAWVRETRRRGQRHPVGPDGG